MLFEFFDSLSTIEQTRRALLYYSQDPDGFMRRFYMQARFVIFPDVSGEHRWRLESANGQIVAASGEGYTRKEDAARAIGDTIGTMVAACANDRGESSLALGAAVGGDVSDVAIDYEGYEALLEKSAVHGED